jgi:hypothetical protein
MAEGRTATESATLAGYSEKSARKQGSLSFAKTPCESFSHADCNFRRNSICRSSARWSPTRRPRKSGTSSAVVGLEERQETFEADAMRKILDCLGFRRALRR